MIIELFAINCGRLLIRRRSAATFENVRQGLKVTDSDGETGEAVMAFIAAFMENPQLASLVQKSEARPAGDSLAAAPHLHRCDDGCAHACLVPGPPQVSLNAFCS
jgi:hypothetical protein